MRLEQIPPTLGSAFLDRGMLECEVSEDHWDKVAAGIANGAIYTCTMRTEDGKEIDLILDAVLNKPKLRMKRVPVA